MTRLMLAITAAAALGTFSIGLLERSEGREPRSAPVRHVPTSDVSSGQGSVAHMEDEIDERGDAQPLVNVKLVTKRVVGVRGVSSQRTLVVTPLADIGTLAPLPELKKKHTSAEFAAAEPKGFDMVQMKLVNISGKTKLPSSGDHSIQLHRSGSKWYATVDGNLGNQLNVTRLVYRTTATNPAVDKIDSFPPTTRWDWSDPDSEGDNLQVVGMPCDTGWCLIGAETAYTQDTDDPNQGLPNTPMKRRVRGWHDRKPWNGDWLIVYPEENLKDLDQEKDFQKKDVNNLPSRVPVAHVVRQFTKFHKVLSLWDPQDVNNPDTWELTVNGGPALSFTRNKKTAKMPGAVRWGNKSDTGLTSNLRNGPLKSIAARLRTFAGISLGDVWIRCASGCCTGDVEY